MVGSGLFGTLQKRGQQTNADAAEHPDGKEEKKVPDVNEINRRGTRLLRRTSTRSTLIYAWRSGVMCTTSDTAWSARG